MAQRFTDNLSATCQSVANVWTRGKHEVYDRLLTGTQVDFQ
jgi:hypothetical protein